MIAAGNRSLGAREIIMVQTTNGLGALTPQAALTSTIMKGSKMAAKAYTPALSAEQVRALLRYEPETGKLFWKERPQSLFSTQRDQQAWNTRYAGTEAFTSLSHGYHTGAIFDRKYRAHRVVWLIQTGEWPEHDIDHINGIRSDNRWANLRSASRSVNLRNRVLSSNNTSGVCGVSWEKTAQKWQAFIHINGRMKSLGRFDDFDAAVAARAAASAEHGYSARHGCLPASIHQSSASEQEGGR